MTEQTTAFIAQGGRALADEDAFIESAVGVPALRPRDILVRVRAVSVNPVDTKVRASLRTGESRILGWDAAGTVEAVGAEATAYSVGDEVFYAGDISRPGSNSTLHAVDERIVGRKPQSLTFAEAAALPLTAITAWETLFERFALTERSTGTLLVLGGAGGVGSIMIQLAKQLTDVTVIATASRDQSRAWVLEQGADHVVGHRALADDVPPLAPDGVRWLFTPYSQGNIPTFARIMAPFGHITAIDEPRGLDILPLKAKSIAWHWELMFTRPVQQTPDMIVQQQLLNSVADLVDAGHIRTTLHTSLAGISAENLRRAHEIVASGSAVGKVVVHD